MSDVTVINSPKAFGEFIGSLSQFWGKLFPLLDTEFPLFFSLVFFYLFLFKILLTTQFVFHFDFAMAQLGPAWLC